MTKYEAIIRTIGYEGGYVNDPRDPGGETKFGISKRAYPGLDVAALTMGEAIEIYARDYWDHLRLDDVADAGVAAEIFDTAVNMGRAAAVVCLQEALNFLGEALDEDGDLGPQTLRACNWWCSKDALALCKALNGFQFRRYVEITRAKPGMNVFSRGWMKRIQEYHEAQGSAPGGNDG